MNKDDFIEQLEAGCEYRLIPLTQGLFTVVDADDYERLSGRKWHTSCTCGCFYAHRSEHGKTISMHREILNVPAGLYCDHKNHNGLDNRRCNLRICTAAQNQHNRKPQAGGTSSYKGVSWKRASRKWLATICYRGRKIYIGSYDYEADAAIAYDDMAIELFGEFACLNFQYRPEVREWLQQSFFFQPTRNDLAGFEEETREPAVCLTAEFKRQQTVLQQRQGVRRADNKKAPA